MEWRAQNFTDKASRLHANLTVQSTPLTSPDEQECLTQKIRYSPGGSYSVEWTQADTGDIMRISVSLDGLMEHYRPDLPSIYPIQFHTPDCPNESDRALDTIKSWTIKVCSTVSWMPTVIDDEVTRYFRFYQLLPYRSDHYRCQQEYYKLVSAAKVRIGRDEELYGGVRHLLSIHVSLC